MNIFTKLVESLDRSGKRRTLFHLQQMSDRQLIDCGFSPELIEQGVKAWPWRKLPDSVEPLQFDQVCNVNSALQKIELSDKSANKSNLQHEVA